MKRRTFLARAGQAAALSAVPGGTLGRQSALASPLSAKEEEVLDAVLQELLPNSEDSPGAVDIGATGYLLTIITDPAVDESDRSFITKGISRIEEFSREKTGSSFAATKGKAREKLLREFVSEGNGESWVSTLITYSLEALFGDPIYGINRDEVGWKWIGHHPGFPRPPKRKWYRDL